MINESTNQTMDQHLIVYYCYLNLKGKEVASASFVELLVIEDSIWGGGGDIYLATKNLLEIL